MDQDLALRHLRLPQRTDSIANLLRINNPHPHQTPPNLAAPSRANILNIHQLALLIQFNHSTNRSIL